MSNENFRQFLQPPEITDSFFENFQLHIEQLEADLIKIDYIFFFNTLKISVCCINKIFIYLILKIIQKKSIFVLIHASKVIGFKKRHTFLFSLSEIFCMVGIINKMQYLEKKKHFEKRILLQENSNFIRKKQDEKADIQWKVQQGSQDCQNISKVGPQVPLSDNFKLCGLKLRQYRLSRTEQGI